MATLDALGSFLDAWWEWSRERSAWRAGSLVCLADEAGLDAFGPFVLAGRDRHRRAIELGKLLDELSKHGRFAIGRTGWRVILHSRHSNAAHYRVEKIDGGAVAEPMDRGAWWRVWMRADLEPGGRGIAALLAREDALRPGTMRPVLLPVDAAAFYLWARTRWRLVRMPVGDRQAARAVPLNGTAGFIAPGEEPGRVVIALRARQARGGEGLELNGSRIYKVPCARGTDGAIGWLNAYGRPFVRWLPLERWLSWSVPFAALIDDRLRAELVEALDSCGPLPAAYRERERLRGLVRATPRPPRFWTEGWRPPVKDEAGWLEIAGVKPRQPTTLEHELRVGARVVGQLRGIA